MAGIVGATSVQSGAAWTEKVKVGADTRLRFEHIDQDGKKTRNRARVRARIKVEGKVNDEIKAKFRLASGGSDPVSTNQSFDDAASTKGLQLDRASLVYSPESFEGLTLEAGKMGNAFKVTKDLLWDGDLSPEGAFATLESGPLNLIGGALWIEESSSGTDQFLYGGIASIVMDLSEDASVEAGVGYFLYDGLKGEGLLVGGDDFDNFGNTTVDTVDPVSMETTDSVYAEDFALVQAFITGKFDVGMPLKVWFDYVTNTDANNAEDSAYQVGASLGKVKNPGDFEVGGYFASKEQDSMVGAWTDSDFGGGGTDVEGLKFWAKLGLLDNVSFGAAWFINDQGLTGSSTDYSRGQFDIVAKF